MICYETDNDNIFQFFYCILSITRSLKKLDNYYNILKKGFTFFDIMQSKKIYYDDCNNVTFGIKTIKAEVM